MESKGIKTIQSVDRAVSILKCFEGREEIGVTEIAKMLGLHKSTAFGLIIRWKRIDYLKKMKRLANIA
ncbi:MAG: helix-turn-helix domain-containing protein [Eubacteriales bacterium]|nr:helix-turn-helix domain-containing protein [Eubacteriales bacterium]